MKILDEAVRALFSLTPCFGGVLDGTPELQPFQRFHRLRKTAVALATTRRPLNTPLQQGVNKSPAPAISIE